MSGLAPGARDGCLHVTAFCRFCVRNPTRRRIMRSVIAILAFSLLGAAPLAHAAMRAQTIGYTAGGKAMQGVLVWDDAVKTPRPGVLMIPDWTGINARSIDFAKTIAGRDYVIFMGDMYGKDVRPKDNDEAPAAAGRPSPSAPACRRGVRGVEDPGRETRSADRFREAGRDRLLLRGYLG